MAGPFQNEATLPPGEVLDETGDLASQRESVERTTILLVDDETIVREAMKRLLESRGMFTVIGQACNGLEGIALAKELRPQIIIMDVTMPVMNGIDATRQIVREMPESKVLVLSRNSDDEVVEKMLTAGATSYLTKHSTGESVVQAVRETKKGHSCFSPAIAERLQERMGEPFRRAKENESLLTQREAEVLQLLAETDSKHAIAHELGISVATVVEHQKQVMQKLGFHEVEALTRYAMNQGSWTRAETGDG